MNREILSILQNEQIDIQGFFDTLPPRTREHCRSVAQMTVRLLGWAREAGLEEEFPPYADGELERAVLYHDIGFTLLPSDLIDKLDVSPAERRVLERHAVYGAQLLDRYRQSESCPPSERTFWQLAAEVAASHHERWDGKGYPHGLRTTAAPLLSRCAAIADAYDCIVRGSSQRMPLPPEYAALEIISNAGKQFDPVLTELFHAHCVPLIMDQSTRPEGL